MQQSIQTRTKTWGVFAPGKGKEFLLDSNDFYFICAGVSNVGGYTEEKRLIIFNLFVTNLLPFEHQRKTVLGALCAFTRTDNFAAI